MNLSTSISAGMNMALHICDLEVLCVVLDIDLQNLAKSG